MFTPLLEKLNRHQDLTADEAAGAMAEIMEGDVLRSLSKNNDVWFPEVKPVPITGTEKENHTSWGRYYRVSDYSSSSRSDWFLGR